MKKAIILVTILLILITIPIFVLPNNIGGQENVAGQVERFAEQLVFNNSGRWISGSYEGFLETKYMNNETNLIDSTYWYVSGNEISEFSRNVRVIRRNDLFGMPEDIRLENMAHQMSSEEWASFWCYDSPEDTFFDGLARYWQGDGWTTGVKVGFIDKTGTFITPPIFDYAENFSNGLAYVSIGEKEGYINTSGEFVDDIDLFDNSSTQEEQAKKSKPLNKDLMVVSADERFDTVKPNGYGLIDSNGDIILPMEYDYISILGNGYVLTQKDNIYMLLYDTQFVSSVPKDDIENNEVDSQKNGISVYLNGLKIYFDQLPIIENDRTLVPFRAIFEALGATVDWDEATQAATGKLNETTIQLTVDSETAYVNEQPILLDVPPKIMNDRTLVPLRFISENFGYIVNWNEEEQRVNIIM